jgi:glycosyltransferase involved in cell wall biosynthesis
MKIAYVNSICHRYDAISNAIRDEIGWLTAAGHDVRLFAYSCDFDDVPYTRVDHETDVAFDPFFQDCELAVFHFGVYYPLFNLLPVVPVRAKRLVVFHNITPKECLPAASHALIDKSFAQASNIEFADHVVCVSETNLAVLRDAGITTPATVLPLAIHTDLHAPPAKPSFADGVLRVLFIGRLVQSKGPLDFLQALEALLRRHPGLRVDAALVANIKFSDEDQVDAVKARIHALDKAFSARLRIRLVGNAAEDVKQQLLSDADLFVLPTRHEGFCVPILEALASGCQVVAYDNSNTPAVSGGLARLVPTGDTAALADAMAAAMALVTGGAWRAGEEYRAATAAAERHVRNFSIPVVRKRFLDFIQRQGGRQSWN